MTRLIVLEGLDGAGTTTQARRLVAHLRAEGRAAHGTREPSDGPIGRLIRELLTGHHAIERTALPSGSADRQGGAPAVDRTALPSGSADRQGGAPAVDRTALPSGSADRQGGAPTAETERIGQSTFGLLFAADRLDHLQREVEPQLAAGAIVVSDRWYHSSLAYQGTGAERDWITLINGRARRPDLTIFLAVRPEVAAERRAAAGRVEELFEDLQMQQDVDAGYRATIAELQALGERIEIIDGELAPDAVFETIVNLVGA